MKGKKWKLLSRQRLSVGWSMPTKNSHPSSLTLLLPSTFLLPPQSLLISLIYQVSQPCYILSFSRCCILRGNLVHYFPILPRRHRKVLSLSKFSPHIYWFSFDPYFDAHDICQIFSQVQFLLNILNIIKIRQIDLLIQSTQGRRNCQNIINLTIIILCQKRPKCPNILVSHINQFF